MIQRIQTIWLLIGAALSAFLFKLPIVQVKGSPGNAYVLEFSGIKHMTETGEVMLQSSIAIPVMLILILLLSVSAVFLFKNRNVQKTVSLVIFALSVCLVIVTAFHSWKLINEFKAALKFSPGIIVPPLLCIVSVLAYKGIARDDNLVKSYDRIR